MNEWDDPRPPRSDPATGGKPIRISDLGRPQSWPLIAMALTRRLALQRTPRPPKRPLDPRLDTIVIDEAHPGMVRRAAEQMRVEVDPGPHWMARLTVGDWKRICFGLAQVVQPDSDRHPHWPEGWRASYQRARRGGW